MKKSAPIGRGGEETKNGRKAKIGKPFLSDTYGGIGQMISRQLRQDPQPNRTC